VNTLDLEIENEKLIGLLRDVQSKTIFNILIGFHRNSYICRIPNQYLLHFLIKIHPKIASNLISIHTCSLAFHFKGCRVFKTVNFCSLTYSHLLAETVAINVSNVNAARGRTLDLHFRGALKPTGRMSECQDGRTMGWQRMSA